MYPSFSNTDETKYSAANAISAAAEALDFPAGVRVGEDTRTSMQAPVQPPKGLHRGLQRVEKALSPR